ncbi:hypothetical protein A6302_01972 [Methylobrevis pamukkalensis]|uniref:Uncharacterized protein n=1 Tax=Methylobrevis pamukkalensis TaxID=1439726 RepID=A0A1E3H2Y4_9HYPH|nr:hypothetical protein A6302_01972 [Methylobrevis pamukkalensis]
MLILCVVHAAIRREAEPAAADSMTAADLLTAMRLLREVEGERTLVSPQPVVTPVVETPEDEAERRAPERRNPDHGEPTLSAVEPVGEASVTPLPSRGMKRE